MSQEIPRQEWQSFFERFSRAHDGEACALAIASPEREPRLRMSPMALASLAAGDGRGIDIRLTGWYGDRLTHHVAAPRRVLLAGDPPRQVLEIEDETARISLELGVAS